MKPNHPPHGAHGDAGCAGLPELKRLNYFYGQLLGVHDFRTEQAYFRDKLKLHNRYLHGYGTVCGLMLAPAPGTQACESDADRARDKLQAALDACAARLEPARQAGDAAALKEIGAAIETLQRELDALPADGRKDAPAARYLLECGLALDCEGNEVIVPRQCEFDPWRLLSADDRKRAQDEDGVDLYLSICYCEVAVDPVRPVMPDACGATPECTHGKLRDAFRLRLGSEAPPADVRCAPCCGSCSDACLLLAVLRGFRKGRGARSIDNGVRRLVSTYPATTITGISWTHGATYTSAEAAEIIGSHEGGSGIQIDFSRPVLASTLTEGVIDLWVIQGGQTQRAGVYHMEGSFDDPGADAVQSIRFTYQGDQNLDPGDRVMITVRCAFILDECCRPVDGVHVGGRVPLIAGFERFGRATEPAACARKPPGYGPWTSGAGTPGSTFESWFYIQKSRTGDKRRTKENAA